MFKANGIVYLDEREWEDDKLRATFPDAQLAKTYEKVYGKAGMTYTERFEHNGLNRKQRRARLHKHG